MECIQTMCTSIGLVQNSWSSVREWYNYQELLHEKRQTLRRRMEALRSRENDVKDELRHAQYGKKPKSIVENWLKDVIDKKTEVQDTEQKAGKRRYLGRSRVLRLVDKNIQEVIELTEQGIFPEGLLIDVHNERGEALLTTPLVGQTTAQRNLEKIWKCLINDEIKCVGVYGMGGVGKTTIATHIHNRLLKNPSCADHVYWVTVSQESSIHKLQNEIAKFIKLHLLTEDDERKRATKLFNALREIKKFVVILDDMWKVFSPEEIGIPIGVDEEGKLLITTRSLEVCRGMKCQQTIKVEILSPEEAWDLFTKNVGSDKVLDQKVEKIARSITEECAGLPLAIVTTARTMRGVDDIHDWRSALDELRESIKEGLIDMEGQVFKILKFSYDRLKDENLQQCFLYCASFPEDYKIPKVDLIVYWIAEGLLDERRSRRAKFDRGHAILNKLENVCLLERVEQRGSIYVKMHDVIRDMTLNITKKNGNGDPIFMAKCDPFEWSENLERVFLYYGIYQHPSISISPKCPRLVSLFFLSNRSITEIPNSFFVHMQSLRVLDLSGLEYLKSLPDSISNLKSLRGLFLNKCRELEYVPSFAELKELRELFLQESGVRALPEGLEGLVNLKCLDMFSVQRIQSIPTGLLSNLSHLQCLRLDDCNNVDVPMEEVISLRQLEMLGVDFFDLNKFNSYVNSQHWQRLSHYCLQFRIFNSQQSLRCRQVTIYDFGGGELDQDQGIALPTNMQELTIFKSFLPRSLLDFAPSLKNNACKDLERCQIFSSEGIEHLWSFTSIPQNLELLKLEHLPDLTSLFKYEEGGGPPSPSPSPAPPPESGTFSLLKLLSVSHCDNLKYLFTPWLVRNHFQNLQLIRVCHCREMVHIIRDDEEEGIINEGNTIITFPKLQNLELIELPKLKSIGRGIMACPSLQEIKVWDCPMLKRLPTMQVDDKGQTSETPTKVISGQTEWWDLLEWDTPEAKSIFQPLFSVCSFSEVYPEFSLDIWYQDSKKRYEEMQDSTLKMFQLKY